MSRVVVNEIEAKVGNDITFNDIVKIDTLKGKTTAGSITVQGEGTATTNLQQGLAKSWVDLNGGTADDSFNLGSDTDNGTGNYSFTFTANMSNANYSVSGSAGTNSNVMHCITAKATTGITVNHRDYSNTLTDLVNSMSTVHGDLA